MNSSLIPEEDFDPERFLNYIPMPHVLLKGNYIRSFKVSFTPPYDNDTLRREKSKVKNRRV